MGILNCTKDELDIQSEAAKMESAGEAAPVKRNVKALKVICRKRLEFDKGQMKLRTLIVLADDAPVMKNSAAEVNENEGETLDELLRNTAAREDVTAADATGPDLRERKEV